MNIPRRGGAGAAQADDSRLAERFELYTCGVELANGFGELTDAKEQRARFVAAMDEKNEFMEPVTPLDEDFLAALAIMPPASAWRWALTGWSCWRPAHLTSISAMDAFRLTPLA